MGRSAYKRKRATEMSAAQMVKILSLPMPTGLADGLGLEDAPLAYAGYTPKFGSSAQSIFRPIRRQTSLFSYLDQRVTV